MTMPAPCSDFAQRLMISLKSLALQSHLMFTHLCVPSMLSTYCFDQHRWKLVLFVLNNFSALCQCWFYSLYLAQSGSTGVLLNLVESKRWFSEEVGSHSNRLFWAAPLSHLSPRSTNSHRCLFSTNVVLLGEASKRTLKCHECQLGRFTHDISLWLIIIIIIMIVFEMHSSYWSLPPLLFSSR